MLIVTTLTTHIRDRRLLLLLGCVALVRAGGIWSARGWGLASRSPWKRGMNLHPKLATVPSSAQEWETSWEYLPRGLVWRLRSLPKGLRFLSLIVKTTTDLFEPG